MRLLICSAFVLLVPAVSFACSDTANDAERLSCYDEKYRAVQMIRCTDVAGTALCEVTSPSAENLVSCTAFDTAATPIARGVGMAGSGILFSELDASKIASLDCEITN